MAPRWRLFSNVALPPWSWLGSCVRLGHVDKQKKKPRLPPNPFCFPSLVFDSVAAEGENRQSDATCGEGNQRSSGRKQHRRSVERHLARASCHDSDTLSWELEIAPTLHREGNRHLSTVSESNSQFRVVVVAGDFGVEFLGPWCGDLQSFAARV